MEKYKFEIEGYAIYTNAETVEEHFKELGQDIPEVWIDAEVKREENEMVSIHDKFREFEELKEEKIDKLIEFLKGL